MIQIEHHQKGNGHGWKLGLRRTWDPEQLVTARHPLLIIPGYGMNSFIFGFHPRGTSMEAFLAQRGFEVWSVDLRAQGKSVREGLAPHAPGSDRRRSPRGSSGGDRYGLAELALEDVAAAVEGVLDRTATSADRVDLIGCSLGTALMFGYVACAEAPRAGRLVNMGGLVRWVTINPLLKAAFSSPRLVGMIPIKGARRLASVALPALTRVPKLLSIYIHPEIVDMSQAAELVRTVEDPNRHVNRDIAAWIQARDLVIRGCNVCDRMAELDHPLLTMVALADGIVPRECAVWPHQNIGSRRRDLLEIGGDGLAIAHADMFVSDHAPELVFEPLADWLERS